MIGPIEGVRRIGVAIQFLTRIPVPAVRFSDGDLRRALGAFPLVGLVVAGVGAGVRFVLITIWDPAPATVGAVAAMILVTGGFHEDGLADTFDGLWGGRTPQERLAIMHDSRLGTYGTLALFLVIGMQIVLLAPLAGSTFVRAVVAGAVLGRASSLPLLRWMALVPGRSAGLAGPPSTAALVVAALTVAVTLGVAFGPGAWIPLAAAALMTALCALVIARKLGGINGDVLGATNRLVDVAAVASCVAISV
ncbi:MAG: adenosylcobinamide-GDP ribazoletransferase [Actinomycetota bacterium]